MKNLQFKSLLSAVTLFSILTVAVTAKAAPVSFNQVVQVVNAKPGKAGTGAFAQIRLINDDTPVSDDDEKNKKVASPQDDRVITEIKAEIVEDDACDCEPVIIPKGGFPKFALLGLGAVPFLFLIPKGEKDTPVRTGEPPTTVTPTPTPPTTPTPTPPKEPVPEPMTILLFGTGLASIGLAARRKFGKKDKEEENQE